MARLLTFPQDAAFHRLALGKDARTVTIRSLP
jgi:hypothetical protein